MIISDLEGRLLTKQEVEELYRSDEGKALLKEYMLSGKIAYAANQAFTYLCELDIFKRDMTYDEIQEICNVLYYSIKYVKWNAIEQFLVESTFQANNDKTPVC